MLRVGLTGNIASGKSSVTKIWRRLGAVVIDADELARRAVEPGTDALRDIEARWGPRILDSDGRLDRAALGGIVFQDSEARRALEAIVHPAVARLRDDEHRAAEAAGESVVVSDIPLLFEVGMEKDFDSIVLVDAPEATRRDRLMRDRGLSREAADRVMATQMPASEKQSRANHVINNSGTLDDLEIAARDVWARLVEESRR
ncbi:MAG: dephospho-CoA kinase [Gemmatimonadetes bacterium]|nr:dephospho-CoA kinase [Gemmatimonadota bacterium]